MDGKRLRELRKKNKLTQEQLGKIIHVTKVSISGYESGERTPDTENLRKLADYFGVTSDYLLGRSDHPSLKEEDMDDPEFVDFVNDVRRWYKEAPKDREEDLKRLKRIFEAYKNDE